MRFGFFLLLLLSLYSCKVNMTKLAGTYSLKQNLKTVLKLNSDSSFTFINIMPNPYLHPFDHPNDNFFSSKGTWSINQASQLVLNSVGKSVNRNPKIERYTTTPPEKFSFVFYDTFGDTIRVLSVEQGDHSLAMKLHGTMPGYSTEKLSTNDTLRFHLYGYNTWTYVNHYTEPQHYAITFYPPIDADLFTNSVFNINGGSITLKKGKTKLKFVRSAVIVHDE